MINAETWYTLDEVVWLQNIEVKVILMQSYAHLFAPTYNMFIYQLLIFNFIQKYLNMIFSIHVLNKFNKILSTLLVIKLLKIYITYFW